MKILPASLTLITGAGITICGCQKRGLPDKQHPNILIAISDDQSWLHTSFEGCKFVNTPGFDRVAHSGIYFSNCYAGSPGSAPSRSSLVTGRYHWQNEQSGQHASSWMKKHIPFVDLLSNNGYYTGFTGKGVGPFQYARNEMDSLWRKENAAGPAFNRYQYKKGDEGDERSAGGIGGNNYFANFRDFINRRKAGKPFYFWYGATEPHRDYEKGSWKRNGKDLKMAEVPGFLPDNDEIKGDLLDYAVEIEWFDLHLVRMLDYLDSIGELKNTIVIVTGDNGMPFPRAKANCFEYGVHVPLAISYQEGFPGKRIVDDPVSFTDFAPTILEMTGTVADGMMPIYGRSLVKILRSGKSGIVDENKKYIFAGRECHSSSRYDNLGYPQRAIRSAQYLLIWNIKPDLWPAGDPQRLKPGSETELLPLFGIDEAGKHNSDWAFTDVDAAPSKSFIVENHSDEEINRFFNLAFDKRPEYEFYDVVNDPDCLINLYGNPELLSIEDEMKKELMQELIRSEDPRIVGPDTEVFDTYIRYSPMREFPRPVPGNN